MQRIKDLNRYQIGVIIFMIAMILTFTVLYIQTISRVGFAYKDTILVPCAENDSIVYTGKLSGEQAQFTVSGDKTVMFRHGEKTYGPYTAKEDPAAIPKDADSADSMTGVELREGDDILFRGGVLKVWDFFWLYNEDGTANSMQVTYVTGDGIERDEHGNIIDPAEPSVSTILELMYGPELTHKGNWLGWVGAVFVCMLNTVYIFFADELFRLHLAMRIRDAYDAEPSDWEIMGRYVGWTVMPIMSLVLFIIGLQ